jgi:RNA polymerase sigma-70 factor (family 1)
VFVDLNELHTDESLLQRMSENDREAFTIIYERYWESLLVTASMAIRNKEEAADIVQEVFMSIWHRRRHMHISSSLKAYLDTSVRYKAIDYIEKNIMRRDYLALLQEMAVHHLPPDAELQLQSKELRETVEKLVMEMPPRMQEVYRLSRHDLLTRKEIAIRLGISEETVKKHIHHALELVKAALGPATKQVMILLFGCLLK